MRKMWASFLATLGIGAAIYGISKYRNGKYLRRIQDLMKDASPQIFNNRNAFVEISEELMPKKVAIRQRKERLNNPG
ncbi:hypothetical protein [Siminovitchia sp. 179-K 8D1 HS]|uniref:hypothetical protein n=1 Tax=Siminovitchia sp. 179-K 8D1 HS TaxID=3142385 RepID=UPI0039A05FDD